MNGDIAGSSLANRKNRDTGPEIAVRRLLHRAGYRYRVCRRPIASLSRTGDIVFPKQRLVVLIDGCFWHGCPKHFVTPKTRTDWWLAKIGTNKRRDAETTRLWSEQGWTVLRFWEHEDPEAVAKSVMDHLAGSNQKSPTGTGSEAT